MKIRKIEMEAPEQYLIQTSQQEVPEKYEDARSVTDMYRRADFQALLLSSIAESQDNTRSGSVVLDTHKMAPLLLQTIKNAVAEELTRN